MALHPVVRRHISHLESRDVDDYTREAERAVAWQLGPNSGVLHRSPACGGRRARQLDPITPEKLALRAGTWCQRCSPTVLE